MTRKTITAIIVFIATTLGSVVLFRVVERLRDKSTTLTQPAETRVILVPQRRKSQDGWAFFDREYKRADKQEIKNRIVEILKRTL